MCVNILVITIFNKIPLVFLKTTKKRVISDPTSDVFS